MGTGRPTTVPNGNRRGDSARPSTRPLDYLGLEGGGRDFASARLTPAAYQHGSALALPEAVCVTCWRRGRCHASTPRFECHSGRVRRPGSHYGCVVTTSSRRLGSRICAPRWPLSLVARIEFPDFAPRGRVPTLGRLRGLLRGCQERTGSASCRAGTGGCQRRGPGSSDSRIRAGA